MTPETIKHKLNEAFRFLKEVADETGINLIDNYGYREYTTLETVREYLPSIKKVVGRTGDDASAVEENYFQIEAKSGTSQNKTLTIKCFPKMLFDKQNDPVRREYIYKYDGLILSFFEYYNPYPTAIVFVPQDQVAKLHPIFRTKQDIKVEDFNRRLAENKKIGHDAIAVNLIEIVDAIGEENLICWLHGNRIDAKEFFHKLDIKTIKINQ